MNVEEMWPYSKSVNVIMRRRRELYILHSNTVLTAIVFFSLLIGKAWVKKNMKKEDFSHERFFFPLPLPFFSWEWKKR